MTPRETWGGLSSGTEDRHMARLGEDSVPCREARLWREPNPTAQGPCDHGWLTSPPGTFPFSSALPFCWVSAALSRASEALSDHPV